VVSCNILLTGATTAYTGTYKLTSVYQGRNYYYNSVARTFLYYNSVRGWSVAPTLGGTPAFYNTQNVVVPNLLTQAWSIAAVKTVCTA
jgi:hypothetical protein